VVVVYLTPKQVVVVAELMDQVDLVVEELQIQMERLILVVVEGHAVHPSPPTQLAEQV
jgi:hypothetical protein|tara:strand:+ start:686 stop:859 length:174 start_codon:yes stop_codon:yes gene_type:complete